MNQLKFTMIWVAQSDILKEPVKSVSFTVRV